MDKQDNYVMVGIQKVEQKLDTIEEKIAVLEYKLAEKSNLVTDNRDEIDKIYTQLSEIKLELVRISDGFPDNNPKEHRNYHERRIQEDTKKKQFIEDTKADILKKVIWGVVVIVGYAVWQYIKTMVGA